MNSSIYRILAIGLLCLTLAACSKEDSVSPADPVAANIKKYETTWDNIMNKGKLDESNETNFSPNITFHMAPENVVGIPKAKAYYGTLPVFSVLNLTLERYLVRGTN